MIPGVAILPLNQFRDARGWLTELFREDELPEGFTPVMGYISVTHPGVARGPHEHEDQCDGFAFINGSMELHLWENRPGKTPCYERHLVGESNRVFVTVPPGVVHAYRNTGDTDCFVLNFPDRLYAGRGKKEPVDEIRHEADPNSPFKMEPASAPHG